MEEIIFSDNSENGFGSVDFSCGEKYTDDCSQYVKRAKIKDALRMVIKGKLDCPFLTEEDCDFYIDYANDFDDDIINNVYDILITDPAMALQKLKKLKRIPKWGKKNLF